jgi:colicin import membrane protein
VIIFRKVLFIGLCIGYFPICQADNSVAKAKVEDAVALNADAVEKAKEEAAKKAKAAADITIANSVSSNDDVAKFKSEIKRKVELSWVRPQGLQDGLHCSILVRLIVDGTVVDAQVVQSSGNDVFDRSAVDAVISAQSFIVPGGKEAFKEFRSFIFVFNP